MDRDGRRASILDLSRWLIDRHTGKPKVGERTGSSWWIRVKRSEDAEDDLVVPSNLVLRKRAPEIRSIQIPQPSAASSSARSVFLILHNNIHHEGLHEGYQAVSSYGSEVLFHNSLLPAVRRTWSRPRSACPRVCLFLMLCATETLLQKY